MADLQRRVVAFLEGRRCAELADLIERHNGIPLAAPCLREVHTPDSPILQESIRRALESDLDVAIFLTGVGTATVFDAARAMHRASELLTKLNAATVVVRGPKPAAVLRKLGVRIDVMGPNTTEELLSVLPLELRGKTVVVQLYGEPNPTLSRSLSNRGAHVLELAPYVWDRPVDPTPILKLLDALDRGEVNALLVTSQAQVANLFDVAERAPNLKGLSADFTPEHGHMGSLVLAAAHHLATQGVFAQ
jgi:uroporphyrinogen-III synthase